VGLRFAGPSGGASAPAGGTNDLDDYDVVEAYDPTTNTWVTKADIPTKRFSFAARAAGGLLYAMGGRIDATETSLATARYISRKGW
jgi:hypothetical protein